ncbi:hypothetical protein HMN09_01177600 [Mycena chlorophos]|uniref:F-box domain-containing protein n=1 Tax=Mycena chlorophos TaxID=658473 RepID=A0A8H6S6P9_MYCCL|nr:hypothetical protein HMN09_01177600 [Mycena chlorophos]
MVVVSAGRRRRELGVGEGGNQIWQVTYLFPVHTLANLARNLPLAPSHEPISLVTSAERPTTSAIISELHFKSQATYGTGSLPPLPRKMPVPELTTEILIKIFEYLSESNWDFRQLIESPPINRQFTALIRLFLFRQFVFHPHMVATNENGRILPWPKSTDSEPGARERQQQRLDFWASDAIAPNMRRCCISVREYPVPAGKGLLKPSFVAMEDNPPDLLLRTFFDYVAAGRFANLTHLQIRTIQLDKARLELLAGVRTLLELDVAFCPFDDDVTPATQTRFSVPRLIIGAYTTSPHPLPAWVSIWEPGSLRQLTICATIELRWDIEEASGSDTWLEDVKPLKSLPRLTELELVLLRGDPDPRYGPRYETYQKIISTKLEATQLDDVYIPSLAALHLPGALLPLFWREKSTFGLKSLVVDNSQRFTFLDSIRSTPAPSWASGLTQLYLTLLCNHFDEDDADARTQEADDIFEPSNLGEIFRAFPALEDLKLELRCTITYTEVNDTILNFVRGLPDLGIFAPTLRNMTINFRLCYFSSPETDPSHSATREEVCAIGDRVVANFSRLESFKLDGAQFTYLWAKEEQTVFYIHGR